MANKLNYNYNITTAEGEVVKTCGFQREDGGEVAIEERFGFVALEMSYFDAEFARLMDTAGFLVHETVSSSQ